MTGRIEAPDRPDTTPHRMGQFNRLLIGGFRVDPLDQHSGMRYFGHPHRNSFLDAMLVSETGQFYFVSLVIARDDDGILTASSWLGGMRVAEAGLAPDSRYAPMQGVVRQSMRAAYSPDFNPIEKAFSRLKAMLRKIDERTVSGLWSLIGKLVDIFQPAECAN